MPYGKPTVAPRRHGIIGVRTSHLRIVHEAAVVRFRTPRVEVLTRTVYSFFTKAAPRRDRLAASTLLSIAQWKMVGPAYRCLDPFITIFTVWGRGK